MNHEGPFSPVQPKSYKGPTCKTAPVVPLRLNCGLCLFAESDRCEVVNLHTHFMGVGMKRRRDFLSVSALKQGFGGGKERQGFM